MFTLITSKYKYLTYLYYSAKVKSKLTKILDKNFYFIYLSQITVTILGTFCTIFTEFMLCKREKIGKINNYELNYSLREI